MFTFSTVGRVNGMSPSRDNRTVYIRLIADPVVGVDLLNDEEPDTIDIAAVKDLLPPGISIDTRISIEGSGCIAARAWTDPNKPGAKSKIIHNTRLQARTIKIAK
jgi:hypothetical protein